MVRLKTFSSEYKIGAIQMVEQKGMTTREASEALGINEGMLGRWRKEFKEGKIQAFPGNGKLSDKDAEIAKLRQENRRLLAEREILYQWCCSLYQCKAISPEFFFISLATFF